MARKTKPSNKIPERKYLYLVIAVVLGIMIGYYFGYDIGFENAIEIYR